MRAKYSNHSSVLLSLKTCTTVPACNPSSRIWSRRPRISVLGSNWLCSVGFVLPFGTGCRFGATSHTPVTLADAGKWCSAVWVGGRPVVPSHSSRRLSFALFLDAVSLSRSRESSGLKPCATARTSRIWWVQYLQLLVKLSVWWLFETSYLKHSNAATTIGKFFTWRKR